MVNLGYLYNKLYYDYINRVDEYESLGKIKDEDIKNYKILCTDDMKVSKLSNVDIFEIRFLTTYPGLLIGSGYTHESKDDNGFKLGMSFDYTTGLPVIPGTSIKGTLRDAFPGAYEEMSEKEVDKFKKDKYQEMADQRRLYIKGKLNELGVEYEDDVSFIKNLERSIFDGTIENDGLLYKISSTTRDVFFDAEIDLEKVKGKSIVSDDYITPHGEDELLNPKPIKFLKVSPDVAIKFGFRFPEKYKALGCIENSKNEVEKKEIISLLNSRQKIELFINILYELGIGAKTNVGYGQLCIKDKNSQIERLIMEKKEIEKKKKIKKMDRIQQIMFDLEQESDSNIQTKLVEIIRMFETMEILEMEKLALELKRFLTEKDMWPGKNKKQKNKVDEIKKYLKIN